MIIGYLSIHLIGLSLGTIILPPTPSFFRKRQAILTDGKKYEDTSLDLTIPRQPAKTTSELCAYTLVWWVLLVFIKLKLAVSRRMVGHLISLMDKIESSFDAGELAVHIMDLGCQYILHSRLLSLRYILLS